MKKLCYLIRIKLSLEQPVQTMPVDTKKPT